MTDGYIDNNDTLDEIMNQKTFMEQIYSKKSLLLIIGTELVGILKLFTLPNLALLYPNDYNLKGYIFGLPVYLDENNPYTISVMTCYADEEGDN